MAALRLCSECGAELSVAEQEGLCTRCLLALGLGEGETSDLPSPTPEMGERFRDYVLLEEIAHGGMGVIYKARQISLDRIVAIKMIRAEWLAREEDIKRFEIEAQAAAQLQHPNIVAIHEVGELDGHPFFSMDYVPGISLAQMARERPLGSRQAARYVQRIAEAILYAHQHGILHRDLKATLAFHIYFGDAAPHLDQLQQLPVDAIGVDLVQTDVKALGSGWNKGLVAGVINGRSSILESPKDLVDVARYLADTVAPRDLYLSSNCELGYLPTVVAEQKVQRLGEAARKVKELVSV